MEAPDDTSIVKKTNNELSNYCLSGMLTSVAEQSRA